MGEGRVETGEKRKREEVLEKERGLAIFIIHIRYLLFMQLSFIHIYFWIDS